jgi:hypothetical protein
MRDPCEQFLCNNIYTVILYRECKRGRERLEMKVALLYQWFRVEASASEIIYIYIISLRAVYSSGFLSGSIYPFFSRIRFPIPRRTSLSLRVNRSTLAGVKVAAVS